MKIGALDLAIVIAYVAAVTLFGLWAGRGARTLADYSAAGRDLPWWVVMISIVATETSTVTFLSIPGFAFGRDLTWLQIALGFAAGRCLVALWMLPQYFRGNFLTSYEVLARRFGGSTQQAASLLFIVTRTLADGIRLFLTALVLHEMTGLPIPWAVAGVGLVMIVYTCVGGVKAVVWTEFAQFGIYVGGALLAFGLLLDRLPGGLSGALADAGAAGKLRVFDLTFDPSEPYSLWAGLLGGIFVTFGSHGVDQLMVQRYFCARNLTDARKAVVVGGLVVLVQFAFFLLLGTALWAFYQAQPLALAGDAGAVAGNDRIFARFILEELPTGVVGLLLGAIFAAAMSSSLNACATAAVRDIRRPTTADTLLPAGELRLTRWLTFAFGAAQIAVGIAAQWLRSSVVASVLGIAAFTTGIVLGVCFLGMFTARVGQRAALAGLVFGLAAMSAIYFATPLAWPWYALAGSALTFGAGWTASHVWPREPAELPLQS
jgi:SSS family solute:Na+ symporter